MKRYMNLNRELWNAWTGHHEGSEEYDVAGYRALRGATCRLKALELEELPDVAGKTLLHLQCHFGLDTLSWARRGAIVTGVDFSERSIELARSLASETGIDAEFVRADLYDLPGVLERSFDIVFTSYGVLAWLPDIRRWAEIASSYVRPGGTFYIAEFHPTAQVFEDVAPDRPLRVAWPYFHSPAPMRFVEDGSYASRGSGYRSVSYEWAHPLGSVVTALIDAGLRVEFLHEFDFACYPMFPRMVRGGDGLWRLPEADASIPLTFSIRARKEGG